MSFDERENDAHDRGFGETSRYAAHLDRGWSLLDRAEFETARHSAHHAQRLRPEAPDAAVLLGAIALAEGDPREGLRWYDAAIELDPEYPEPYVAAAQIACFDLGDPHRALDYCDEALELAVASEMETIELVLLAAECEIGTGRVQEALGRLDPLSEHPMIRAVLERRTTPDDSADDAPTRHGPLRELAFDDDGEPLDDEDREGQIHRILHFSLRVARLWLDAERTEAARSLLQSLVEQYPGHVDAWHLLSEAEFLADDPRAGCHAALRVYRLDSQVPTPDWLPSPAELNRKVVDVLASCGDDTLRELGQRRLALILLVHDVPSLELVLEGTDPRLPALALMTRGLPPAGQAPARPPEPPAEGEPPLITGLAIYRRNLARLARAPEFFDQELRYAILDELATALQFPNERRIKLGLGPLPGLGGQEEEAPREDEGRPSRERRRRKRMLS